jgi:sugar lactone lactonase YvrE
MASFWQQTSVAVFVVVAAVAGCNSSADHPPALSNQEGTGLDATVPPAPVEDASGVIPHDTGTPSHDASADASLDATPADAVASCSANQPDADILQMMCGGQCVNINTDSHNCGGCSQPCAITQSVCIQGKCVCPTTQTVCSNQCVDTSTDGSNCGFCGHNCQGNPCSAGLCQPSNIAQATQGGTIIAGIAIDATYVYWTQAPPASTSTAGTGAFRRRFSGGSAALLGAAIAPRGIVVDSTDAFWADFADGSITATTTALIGGSLVHIYPPIAPDAGPSAGPTAVARDPNNVYWVDSTAGTVNQMPVTQGPLQGGTVLVLASGRQLPVAIAVDATNVYWVDYGTGSNGSVNKVPIGTPNAITTLSPSEQQPSAIAVDATNIYWADKVNTIGTVKSIPIGGGSINPIAQNQGAPAGVAVDSQYVYWTNYDDNTVRKAPLAGGMSFTFASGQNNPSAIAVDNTSVYWANQGSGIIMKVAK